MVKDHTFALFNFGTLLPDGNFYDLDRQKAKVHQETKQENCVTTKQKVHCTDQYASIQNSTRKLPCRKLITFALCTVHRPLV